MATRRQSPELIARRKALAKKLFPPGPDHPASRYDRASRAKVVRMLKALVPIKEICRAVGCSRATVDRYRVEAGVGRRRKPARYDEARFAPGWKLIDGRPVYVGE